MFIIYISMQLYTLIYTQDVIIYISMKLYTRITLLITKLWDAFSFEDYNFVVGEVRGERILDERL